jgi:formylglycine-generating enzyme required for sulfatase activity
MSETQAAASTKASVADDGDWLGYGAYADALWSRIETALAKDLIKGDLGDDPLVIGIFGEWGAGKSYLLRLMHDQSKAYAKKRLGWHRDKDTGFGLTVPVVFQPWKYEHEPHLHVPLMLHIFQALQRYEKDAQVPSEKAREWAGEQWEAAKKAIPGAVEKFKGLLKSSIAAMDPTTAAIATGGLGVAAVLAKFLKPIESAKPDPLKTFKYSEDGRFFYEMHEALKDVTRPTRQNGQKRKYSASDIAINFVVFVDDLDRCLPEKAVQTLELIKTMFNIESFAFVLALDDEVIERGIGHRYKEYKLQDKKPEMPITGFEYLEKIVHLPFKLPAVSQTQARAFLKKAETALVSHDKKQRETALADGHIPWFQPQPDQNKMARVERGVQKEEDVAAAAESVEYDLGRLVLMSFDAYVPRKLLRIVELWHTTAQVAQARHKDDPRKPILAADSSSPIDIRIALALQMVQLFHPDLYRVFRRREATFATLFNAFDGSTTGLSASRSDLDLWRWAAYQGGESVPGTPPAAYKKNSVARTCPIDAASTLALIAQLEIDRRYPAQQNRLPLVERIIDHRLAQRHVFDPLKLFAELCKQVTRLPEGFAIGQYFSLLAPFDEPAERVHQSIVKADIPGEAIFKHTRSADPADPQALYNNLIADDEALQQGLLAAAGLPEGAVLSARAAESLEISVGAWISAGEGKFDPRKARQLLKGLMYLAPVLSNDDGATFWAFVEKCVDVQTEEDAKTRALWGDVRRALGCDDRFDKVVPYAMSSRHAGHSDADEPIPGFVRVPASKFTMGSSHEQDKTDNPPQEVEILRDFYMQRTLVTVDQYAGFVQAKAYVADKWWDKQGIEWRDGLFDSKIGNEDYKKHLARRGKELRHQPMLWDEQKAYGSRPVWGINWFEARAYCRWLSEQLSPRIGVIAALKDHVVQLPTELQWERAARATNLTQADTRMWPWDDDESMANQKANLNKTIGSVCAVGLYEANPIGLFDMAGNVWEWMDNLYQLTPNAFERIPRNKELKSAEDFDASDRPSLRGGSWFSTPDFARCSFRGRGHPVNWNNDLGFRVVLSLAE